MEDKKKSFKDLILWQKADLLYHNIADDVLGFPRNKVADTLAYQLLDAAGSVSANVVEGYGRGGSKEFRQFLRVARGSLGETDNWLIKATKRNFISEDRYREHLRLMEEIGKMITAFIGKLTKQATS